MEVEFFGMDHNNYVFLEPGIGNVLRLIPSSRTADCEKDTPILMQFPWLSVDFECPEAHGEERAEHTINMDMTRTRAPHNSRRRFCSEVC